MPTMREIAKRAGVSYTTVSYILNQRETDRGFSAETRQKVLDAAEAMGYRRNELARAVVTGKRTVLGFIAREPREDAEFIAHVLTGVINGASEQGYLVKALYVPRDAPRTSVIDQCLAWRVGGVVTVGLGPEATEEFRASFSPEAVGLATVEDIPGADGVSHIVSDEERAMGESVNHLTALGHTRIAYLAGTASDPLARRRADRFRRLVGDEVYWGDWWDVETNREVASGLLSRPAGTRQTALLCSGDPAALVVLRVARQHGLTVPGDLSVIGYGDYTMATYSDPPLTTVAQPFRDMGFAAVRAVLDPTGTPGVLTLPTRLIVRETTGQTSGSRQV